MPFCRSCGSPVEGRFCAKCGTPVAADAAAPPQPPPAQPPAQPPYATGAPAAAVGLDDNVAALLTYLIPFVGPILFLTLAPYNQKKNIRFHAFQALFLDVAYVGLWIAWEVVASLIGSVWNFTLWRIWGLVWTLVWVSFLAVAVYAMIKAYQGEQKELPVIGPLARQKA